MEWINVEEKLPPDREPQLLFSRNFIMPILGWRDEENNQWWGRGFDKIDNITHWMPLPPPPTGE